MANYLKLLQMSLLEELSAQINKRLSAEGKTPISASADDVFKNLIHLYDEKRELEFAQETGRSYKFMPKKYKAMVMRLVAPNYCISTKIQSSDAGVTAEAYLFLTPESAKPVAQGKQFLPFDKAPDSLETEAERKAYIEATAKGLAHSKAYQEFGIGSWYSYQYEPEDNPDIVVNLLKEQDDLNPVIGYGNCSQDETESGPQISQPSFSSPSSDTPKSDPPAAISLEEARNYPAPLGKAKSKGLTLGETAESYPANIYWMYRQSELSEYDKAAIRTIAASSPKVYDIFQQHGEAI